MHSDQLTIDEHLAHPLHQEFTKRIEQLRTPDLTVLDWGCGRGSDVAHLRKLGIKAYGAEISRAVIDRGKGLFDGLGLEHAEIVKQIRPDNTTDYPSSFFDVLISYQVLEHVEDLESAVREMSRIMKPGGTGIHLYPAHHCVVEGHLKMPIVHWLPKGAARHTAIRFFTSLGIEPRWSQLSDLPAREKADRYFEYSVHETFYRSPKEVMDTFGKAGFYSSFESHKHVRVVRSHLNQLLPAPLLGWLLTNFYGCVLVTRKSTAYVEHDAAIFRQQHGVA